MNEDPAEAYFAAQRAGVERYETAAWPRVVALIIYALLIAAVVFWGQKAHAHDIYTGVHGKNGQLCCGGDDCAATIFRERGDTYQFRTRENHWVTIPQERITFLPIPGDVYSPIDGDIQHYAHLCYRKATDFDKAGPSSVSVFTPEDGSPAIFLYCAFIPPGAT